MSQDTKPFIYQKIIEEVWKESGAWPEFIQAMRLTLPDREDCSDLGRDPARWMLLPALCCQAAGGQPIWAEDIATAWFILYAAAHIFDSIEDQDQPDTWMEEIGSGEAINIASGLLFTASAVLNRFHRSGKFGSTAGEICSRFYQSVLSMSSGQHIDLVTEHPGLDTWFKIAEAKSGSFFSLACWSGARLSISEPAILDGYARFGSNLGVLLQIHDDLEELRQLHDRGAETIPKGITRSLPFVYALEVFPERERKRLLQSLEEENKIEQKILEVVNLLDQCGVSFYLKVESERRQLDALSALESARPDPSVKDQLTAYLEFFKVK